MHREVSCEQPPFYNLQIQIYRPYRTVSAAVRSLMSVVAPASRRKLQQKVEAIFTQFVSKILY